MFSYIIMDDERFRNVCITLNNWTEDEYIALKNMECTYAVFGKEIGESGTPHIQGYAEFKKKISLKNLKKISNRVCWINRDGTARQASDYCKKGEQTKEEWKQFHTKGPNYGLNADFFEEGNISKQGERKDIEAVTTLIINRTPMREIAIENPFIYVKFHRGFHALENILLLDRTEAPIVKWYWGSTGTGKTRKATMENENYYIKDESKWWDGYSQQPLIIIDDFDEKTWNFRNLLRLLDKYKYQGQVKCGYVKINSPLIIITCEFPPKAIWSEKNLLSQILRRLSVIEEICPEDVAQK